LALRAWRKPQPRTAAAQPIALIPARSFETSLNQHL
jgi:hypothetical protein